ncbi:MAG: hypothetical protein OEU26_28005, partial [Candidatus Tectomicrobia bacterium]|nr:hypothetical protein [Candidatus Tectomicrobia bacterium]
MAEDHVSRDQHRADMAELRGELKEEIAGIRQDIAVLVKVVEVQGQRMEQGFADLRREMMQMQTGMDRQFAELRLDIRE